VETEERDEDSILAYYKKLVQLRKDHEIIADGDIHFLETGTDDVIAYERTLGEEKLTVYCNLKGYEVPVADFAKGEILISNYAAEELRDGALKPYEARVVVR
jgi:glycosidase